MRLTEFTADGVFLGSRHINNYVDIRSCRQEISVSCRSSSFQRSAVIHGDDLCQRSEKRQLKSGAITLKHERRPSLTFCRAIRPLPYPCLHPQNRIGVWRFALQRMVKMGWITLDNRFPTGPDGPIRPRLHELAELHSMRAYCRAADLESIPQRRGVVDTESACRTPRTFMLAVLTSDVSPQRWPSGWRCSTCPRRYRMSGSLTPLDNGAAKYLGPWWEKSGSVAGRRYECFHLVVVVQEFVVLG